MDRAIERRFLAEIETQCAFGLRAEQDLGKSLVQEDTDGVWYALQIALVAAANISKLLWGAPRRPEEARRIAAARQQLRQSLVTKKTSPLHHRGVRNAFEHFDAELEDLPRTRYASRTVGPQDLIPRFGHFDPRTGLVTFGRESINTVMVFSEFARLRPLALAEFRKKL